MHDQLARLVADYLNEHPVHAAQVTGAEPLRRCFHIRQATWRPWLTDGGTGRAGYVGQLDSDVAVAALSVLTDLQQATGAPGRASVCRATLQQWAAAMVANSFADRDLIRLWVAVRMWGSPTRFGPIQTAQGLADPRCLGALRSTARAVVDGDLIGAYEQFALKGTQEPYSTKWFWAASLASPTPEHRALISDSRVNGTLAIIPDSGVNRVWRKDSSGYRDYVDLLHRVSATVSGAPHTRWVDPEKVEWLLFDRPRPRARTSHSWTTEPCFHTWLTNKGSVS
ncbi:8-oxoguanine DNA glycosylase OGG fold protein [Micromonospora sp. LH3U1]|uniref:8-oxoguanine DNA glycosylase OGG fold protein n=1 Tax=Micromonospora sp. LH3U1 TaxID=3018339 RepID=UPI003FA5DFD3